MTNNPSGPLTLQVAQDGEAQQGGGTACQAMSELSRGINSMIIRMQGLGLMGKKNTGLVHIG